MDYLTYYGLAEEPFRITPDAGCFFASRSHHNALLSLAYSTDHREGFCLVTGEPGTGKTTLLKVFLEKYRHKAETAMVLTPKLSPDEFLLTVLEDLGVQCPRTNKNEVIRTFRDFLVQKSLEGTGVIVLVDEAQNLPDETLEELRLLSNLETEKEKLLHIILVGQPELALRLKSPQLRQLDQRIITRVGLGPLDMKEAGEYISFRLTKAGRGHVRFTEGAVRSIYRYSKGIPRLINTVATRTLMSAFLQEAGEVEPAHVRYAARSLKLEERRNRIRISTVRPVFLAGFALAAMSYFVYPAILELYFDRTVAMGNAEAIVQAIKESHASSARRDPRGGAAEAEAVPASLDGVTDRASPGSGSVGREEFAGVERAEISTAAPVPPEETDNPDQNGPDLVTAFIIAHSANVRNSAGLSSEKIAYLQQGEKVRLLKETADVNGVLWHKIDLEDGNSGWISSKVLSVTAGE